MFSNLKDFFDLLDVNPIWPTVIVIAEIIDCFIPYKPIGKVKKSKDKDGNEIYKIYKNRK